jgi:purine-cytosine permease-like protein
MTKIGSKIGTAALVVILLGFLAVSVWFASQSWLAVDGPPMPTQGYIAMTLGVVFSVLIGCGLMALVFYSHRYGYDDASHRDQRRTDSDRDQLRGR